jgi:hypothetical protein
MQCRLGKLPGLLYNVSYLSFQEKNMGYGIPLNQIMGFLIIVVMAIVGYKVYKDGKKNKK